MAEISTASSLYYVSFSCTNPNYLCFTYESLSFSWSEKENTPSRMVSMASLSGIMPPRPSLASDKTAPSCNIRKHLLRQWVLSIGPTLASPVSTSTHARLNTSTILALFWFTPVLLPLLAAVLPLLAQHPGSVAALLPSQDTSSARLPTGSGQNIGSAPGSWSGKIPGCLLSSSQGTEALPSAQGTPCRPPWELPLPSKVDPTLYDRALGSRSTIFESIALLQSWFIPDGLKI